MIQVSGYFSIGYIAMRAWHGVCPYGPYNQGAPALMFNELERRQTR